MPERTCPTGCGRTVKRGKLLCYDCWSQVPKHIQMDVNRTWRATNADPKDDAKFEAYEAARQAAMAAVP